MGCGNFPVLLKKYEDFFLSIVSAQSRVNLAVTQDSGFKAQDSALNVLLSKQIASINWRIGQ
jgi:hypothetical protein